jgi:hypothetical protein
MRSDFPSLSPFSASLDSGVKANFGTMVKPLHVSQCARNGLLATLLADAGYGHGVFGTYTADDLERDRSEPQRLGF